MSLTTSGSDGAHKSSPLYSFVVSEIIITFAVSSQIEVAIMGVEIRERYIDPYTYFGFKKLFGTELNKDLLIKESVKDYWDYYSTMTTAHQKGRAEGCEEGRAEERLANARSLLDNGVPVDVIVKSLCLTPDEVELLSKN